jgi:toxin ParE1/3/4
MKPVIIHREAKAELDEAIGWYNDKQDGLGLDLQEEVENAVVRIERDSGVGASYRNTDFRFCHVKRFPYILYYLELDDYLWVAAIAHERRRPGYWRKRSP